MGDSGFIIDPSKLPGVTDLEASELIQVSNVSRGDCSPPKLQFAIPKEATEELFKYVCGVMRNFGVPTWIAHIIAGITIAPILGFNVLLSVGVALLRPLLSVALKEVLGILDTLRKNLDPSIAEAAVLVLNEFLGTDFTAEHLPQGIDVASHLARAQEIGLIFHRQLMSEFVTSTGITLNPKEGTFSEPTSNTGAGEKITPLSGVRAAATFSGLAINFGTANGLLAFLGGIVPFGHVDEIREIGEEVAKNLGIGRLQRLALAPIVQILLAEPYKWFINELARPKQFGLGEVVNSFSGAVMPAELIWGSLAREGYSDDKIAAVLELHRKKLDEASVFTLFRGGHMQEEDVLAYYKRLGYSDDDARRKKEADLLKANQAYVDELRGAVTTAYADGHIDRAEFAGIIDGMPLRHEERDNVN